MPDKCFKTTILPFARGLVSEKLNGRGKSFSLGANSKYLLFINTKTGQTRQIDRAQCYHQLTVHKLEQFSLGPDDFLTTFEKIFRN